MLDPIIVQILLGIIFFTTFFEGLGVQLNEYLKKKGEATPVSATSQQIKYKPRQISMMGQILWDLSLVFVGLNIFLFPIINRFVPQWDFSVFTSGIQLLGFSLSLCGCLLLFLAYLALGINWVHWIQKDRKMHSEKGAQLIQAGPYKYVRHPVYLAEYLILGGCVFLLLDWIVLILYIFGGIGIYSLAKDEERLDMDQFGDAYRDYIKRTGRFFPKMRK